MDWFSANIIEMNDFRNCEKIQKGIIFTITKYANIYFCTAIQMCICMEHTQKCMVISYFSLEILSAICLRFKTAKSNQVLSKQGHATVFDVFGANMSRMLPFRQ